MKYTLYDTDIPDENLLCKLYLDTFAEIWEKIPDDEPIAFYGYGGAYGFMKLQVNNGKLKNAYKKNVVCVIENDPKKKELNVYADSCVIGIEHVSEYKFNNIFLTGFESRHQMRRDIMNYDESIEIIDIYEILEQRGVSYDRPYNSYKERLCRFGDLYPDVTFYVIRRSNPNAGFFSNYRHVLARIIEAKQHGFVPVVDMENYDTMYNEDVPINGTQNAWEYYFNQPTGYSLSEVYKSKNVVLSDGGHAYYAMQNNDFTDDDIKFFHSIIEENIVFNEHIEPYIEARTTSTLPLGKKVLGVIARGTDYVNLQLHGHPTQPEVDDLIEAVKNKYDEWQMEYIYLATEDLYIVDKFRHAFPDVLIMTDSLRFRDYDTSRLLPEIRRDREHDKYYSGLEYLSDIIILSRCNAIVGTKINGMYGALFLNGGAYEHKHIIDLGNY